MIFVRILPKFKIKTFNKIIATNAKNRKNQIIVNKTVKKMCGTAKKVNRTDNSSLVRGRKSPI